jgi:hypothetical protein
MVCMGVVVELLPAYGELDARFALVLSVILAVYMLLMLWHSSASESPPSWLLTDARRTKRKILLLIVLSRRSFRLSSLSSSTKISKLFRSKLVARLATEPEEA